MGASGKVKNVRLNARQIWGLLPISDAVPEDGRGERIRFAGGTQAFSEFWQANREILVYRAFLRGEVPEPLFYIEGTDKPVAGIWKIGSGNLVLLPGPAQAEADSGFLPHDTQFLEQHRAFFQSVETLVSALESDLGKEHPLG